MTEMIHSNEDILKMLDSLLQEQSRFNWNTFYSERDRPIPFFVNAPDENLVQYFKHNIFTSGGKVLDLGCGPGRNAIYFASKGMMLMP